MYFSSLFVFVTALRKRPNLPYMRYFHVYALASALQTTIFVFLLHKTILGFNIDNYFLKITIVCFLVVEIIVVYHFFYHNPVLSKITKLILPFALLSFFILLWQIVYPNIRRKVLISDTYFAEALFILFPCFSYFFQLLKIPPTLSLTNEPSFWVTAGLMIYFLLSLPMFFIPKYFETPNLYEISSTSTYIGYTIIFLFLSRAYLCNPKTTT